MKQTFQIQTFRLFVISVIFLLSASFNSKKENYIPIWFDEYDVEIRAISKIADTIFYNKSSIEDFKFVFYDARGKCYCERYLNGKLFERGNFENSLDTLKRYVSGRSSNGETSPIKVQIYFEPLKSGEWMIYKSGKVVKKQQYILGIIQNRNKN